MGSGTELNTISFSARNLFSASENYQFTAYGDMQLPKGKVSYSADVSLWRNSSLPAIIRDTWLSYSTRTLTVTGGNISRNMDINLNGRGAAFAFRPSEGTSFETGFITSVPVLWGYSWSLYSPGKAGWATFQHTGKLWEIKNSLIADVNPQLGSKDVLLLNELSLNGEKFRYTLTLNPGRTSEYGNNTRGKPVWAAGLAMNGRTGNLSLSSSNFVSSSYYPGLRRGVVDLSERLSYSGRTVSWWAQASYYSYEPRYFNNFIYLSQGSTIINSKTGISFTAGKSGSISLSPGYYFEKGSSYYFSMAHPAWLRSFGLNTAIRTSANYGRYFSLIADAGFSRSSLDSVARPQLRLNASYRRAWFNLNFSYQNGNFLLAEAASNHYLGTGSTKLLNVAPTIRGQILKGKGEIEAGLTYIRQVNTSDNILLRGDLTYSIAPGTTLSAGLNLNQYYYTGRQYICNTFEMGIRQKIGSPRISTGSSSLEVFLFKDNNQNGDYDPEDSIARNSLIYINNVPFIADQRGCVRYTGLPEGNYEVSVPAAGGWYAASQLVRVRKKTKLAVAMHQNGALRGKIAYTSGKLDYRIVQEKQGLTVTAKGDNGLSFNTKTDEKGNFTFFLPQGIYTVFISPDALPDKVECPDNNQKITVSPEESRSVNFELRIKQRQVDVQRFVSPSLSKRNN